MTVDFKSLRDCDPSTLSPVAGQWGRAKSKLGDAHTTATGVNTKMSNGAWFGRAADAAVDSTGKYVGQLSSGESEADTIKGIINDAREMFTDSKEKLDEALDDVAADESLRVDDNGRVTVELSGNLAELSGECKAQILADKEAKAEDLQTRIDTAVEQAQCDDEATADALRGACDYASGSSAFSPDANRQGLGLWFEYRASRFGGGSLFELKGLLGYRDEHDFGREGKLEWKVGAQGTAGGYAPDNPSTDDPGLWANGFAGLDVTYKAPTTDLGLEGVEANFDFNAQVGPSTGAGVNDPRLYNVEFNGDDVRIQSNVFSHTFEKVPITIGMNVDVTVDLDEYRENLLIDFPRLPDS